MGQQVPLEEQLVGRLWVLAAAVAAAAAAASGTASAAVAAAAFEWRKMAAPGGPGSCQP